MNITRVGLASLIVGLILLMNASSSHVSGINSVSYDIMGENETQYYVILTAPVGVANLTIGLQPTFDASLPAGFGRYNLVEIPVHLKVYDPANQTLAEQDIVTPYSFDVNFKARGSYKVYVTNKGTENSTIPVSVIFERNNPQNREADKFLLSIALTAIGTILIPTSMIMKLVLKRRQLHK